MEVNPGFKQTEIGLMPKDWQVKRLGELFEITSSKRVFQSEWKTEGIPFYRARELAILGESGYVNNELFISREMYETYRNIYGVPKIGDMLVTGVGTLGKVYVVSDDHKFYFKDGNIIWFQISGKVRSEFLKQLYLTELITKQISDASAGTTVGTYTISGAKKTAIPFPSLAEQEAIAEPLRDVDILIESLEQLIVKKRYVKYGTMQELLRPKKAWKKQKLGELATLINGRAYSLTEWEKIGTPVIRLQNLTGRGETFYYSNLQLPDRQYCRSGDLLYMWSATFGPIIWQGPKAIFHYHIWKIECQPKKLNKSYLYYLLSDITEKLKSSLSSGGTMLHLTKSSMEAMEISIPCYDEQEKIAAVLSDMDSETATLETNLVKVRELKQGMMQGLLTGRIRLL